MSYTRAAAQRAAVRGAALIDAQMQRQAELNAEAMLRATARRR